MKKILARSKEEIKLLLYTGHILGVKDDQYRAFGGFQRWLYNKELNECHSCESHWNDRKKKVRVYSLDKAAKLLWRRRNRLFMYTKASPTSHNPGLESDLVRS